MGDAEADKARQERLAAALRSNLARRKAKVRAGQEQARAGKAGRGKMGAPGADAADPGEGEPGDPRP